MLDVLWLYRLNLVSLTGQASALTCRHSTQIFFSRQDLVKFPELVLKSRSSCLIFTSGYDDLHSQAWIKLFIDYSSSTLQITMVIFPVLYKCKFLLLQTLPSLQFFLVIPQCPCRHPPPIPRIDCYTEENGHINYSLSIISALRHFPPGSK